MGVGSCIVVLATVACGKKGPPLAPLVPIPAAVQQIEATRLGTDVYITLTVPAANVDEYTPADLARVEIYGYTGRTAPPRARWVELAALVASVPIAPPVVPAGDEAEAPAKEAQPQDSAGAKQIPRDAPLQGSQITVRDTLTHDELIQGKLPPVDPRLKNREPGTGNREPGTEPLNKNLEPGTRNLEPKVEPLKRFYTAVPFNAKGRPGPPGGVSEFALDPAPDAPPSLVAAYTDRAIVLEWEPSGGLIGFLLERTLPEEPAPILDEEGGETTTLEAPGPPVYYVYREILPDMTTAPSPPDAAWREAPPAPLGPVPAMTLQATDSIEFERRRCYRVRAVRGSGPTARIGDASPEACLTPIDVFPPAPPHSLATVASEGAISLIWEPNTELDLGGYIVLRGEAPGDTLRPLTTAPVVEPSYRDGTVKPGVRYVYAVIAVDNRLPLPNMSAESTRMEETAR